MDGNLMSDHCQQCGMPITSVRDCKSKRAGLCTRCFKRLYDKAYRAVHKDRYKKYSQRYYQANRRELREKNTVQKRAWRDANRQHYREYQRDYKRRMRRGEEYPWQEMPQTCSSCGEDISTRWGTRSRRAGLCPPCYRRRTQAGYYRRIKEQDHTEPTLEHPERPKHRQYLTVGKASEAR